MNKKTTIFISDVKNILLKLYLARDLNFYVDKDMFRANNEEYLDLLDNLESSCVIRRKNIDCKNYYEFHEYSLYLIKDLNNDLRRFYSESILIFDYLKTFYKKYQQNKEVSSDEIIIETNVSILSIKMFVSFLGFFSSRPNETFNLDSFTMRLSENIIKYKLFENYLDSFMNYPNELTERLNEKNSIPFISTTTEHKVKEKTNKIFIVHGHDQSLKNEVSIFLRKIKLEPIVLHEQSNKGKTIIEKLEFYTDVDYAVILYTACDIGGKDEDNLNFRARQNVVFEHGYLMSKLGRENICIIKKGAVEIPNDLSGSVYVTDKSNWQLELISELKTANFEINANDLF